MRIVAQIGECDDHIRQFARYEAIVGAHGGEPLELARVLIRAGYDPASEYETARGDRTAMRYGSLAHAARQTVWETPNGPVMVRWRPNERHGQSQPT
jgi:hypothetical protein